MKKTLFWTAAVLTALPLLAHAQPDANNAPKAANPQNRPPGGGGNGGGNGQKRMEEFFRRQLTEIGVADAASQDTLLSYMKTEMEARTALMDKGGQLAKGLRDGTLTNPQIGALLNEYQAAIEDDKTRRQLSQAELAKKVDYAKNPKLEAWLVVLGAVGDGPPLMGGNGNNRPRGGQGQGQGQGQGPRNGQNNRNTNRPAVTAPAPAPAPAGDAPQPAAKEDGQN